MSENNNSIYNKALLFTVVAAVVILIGTIITVFVPLMTDAMHPTLKDENNQLVEYRYTPLELAGRDVYQKEGCINCHTQTVRPLTADVLRYGEVSQPGESAYERPFLWGSKRTGPDLARVGGVYSDEWQKAHLINPQHFFEKSNMPKYPWLAAKQIDVAEATERAKTFGAVVTEDTLAELEGKTELDAMVAYLQKLGTYVQNTKAVIASEAEFIDQTNPFQPEGNEASTKGAELYNKLCAGCHGSTGQLNVEGYDVTSATFADTVPSMSDGEIFLAIANGYEGAMPSHLKIMTKDDIWALSAYVRSLVKEAK